jgi:hypothetical protein
MDIIADRHPYTPSVTRTPGASAQPRDESLDQGMAISIPGGVALSDTPWTEAKSRTVSRSETRSRVASWRCCGIRGEAGTISECCCRSSTAW